MSVMNERIEVAFNDELLRIKHEGITRFLQAPLDAILFMVYRRGYIRGHSDRSREVQQDEEQSRREGKYPMGVAIKYEGTTLILDGKDVTPKLPTPQQPKTPPVEYRP